MVNIGNPKSSYAVNDVRSHLPVRELCHDLLESAATIGLLAQAADMEAGPAVAPDSQLPSQLRLITAAAGQIAGICTQVLDQCNPSGTPVLMPLTSPA